MADRHGIGGNAPPPDVAIGMHVEELFSTVSGSTTVPITTDEQEQQLDALLDDIRQARKDADTKRAAEKRPYDDAAKAVQAKWKPILDRCDAAGNALKAHLTPYRQAKLEAAEKAAREARERAEAEQEAARNALKASDDLESKFAAEEKLKQADKLAKVANGIERAPTGLRTYYEAEITDRRLALNHYIKTNPDAFASLIQSLVDADARGARAPVPGVTFHERKKAQ